MSIGKIIKQRRHEKNMTLEEVAKKINISRQTLSRYENDIITNIPADRIEQLAKVLGCSPASLMGWENIGFVDSEKEIEDYNKSKRKATAKVKPPQDRYKKLNGILDTVNNEGLEDVEKYAEFIASKSEYKKHGQVDMVERA